MNVLFERFPESVRVDGRDYRIVTDFREWIKLQMLLENTERFTPWVVEMLLEWYIDVPPKNLKGAIDALCGFLSAEELYGKEAKAEGSGTAGVSKEVFSFEQDATCIYCAFRSVYQIDLETVPYLHWWKFLLLFGGLPADTEIQERIYYRGVDLNQIKSKEERKRVKEIKKRIALKRREKRKMDDYQIGAMF